jgi:hypothetical protein
MIAPTLRSLTPSLMLILVYSLTFYRAVQNLPYRKEL